MGGRGDQAGSRYHTGIHMYAVVLFVHSWLRWVLLAAALYALARALRGVLGKRAWQAHDARAQRVLVELANLQFTLGLLLYVWLSPIVRSALANIGLAMRSAPLRFFAIEHITAMVLAVGVLHVAKARVRKAATDIRRQRAALWGSGAFLLLALVGIPWPALKHGRPLARTQLFEPDAPADTTAPDVYRSRCAACHGAAGRGDGLAAIAMQPRPRDFAEQGWQHSVTDEALRAVIAQGGLARDLSASMPPHPDLRPAQLDELVRFIRSVPALAAPGK